MRERNKKIRRDRIFDAARNLFVTQGYDVTTAQDIADEAGVGIGTIFRNVRDKRHLLFLLFEEDHAKIDANAFEDLDETDGFVDRIVAALSHYYRYFAENPEFSRSLLRELTFDSFGENVIKLGPFRRRILDGIVELLGDSRRSGEINCSHPDESIALLIFEIYQVECRRWLNADNPSVDRGLIELGGMLNILFEGLKDARALRGSMGGSVRTPAARPPKTA